MKKQLLLPLAAIAGGAAALVLRLLQNQTGFEPGTGLPVSGNAPGLALAVLLVALAAALAMLARLLPREEETGPFFPEDFRTESAGLLALCIAGIFLMAVSGALDILQGAGLIGAYTDGVGPDGETAVLSASGMAYIFSGVISPRAQILMGGLTLAAAAALFPAAASCRRRPGVRSRAASPVLLLIPPVCLVVRLVLIYRVDSVNPALQAYYVEILALAFLTLAYYRLSSFAYRAAKTRRFALYAGAAVTLCITAMADGQGISALLLYAGSALSLLGFLLLWLTEGRPVAEIVEDGD